MLRRGIEASYMHPALALIKTGKTLKFG